MQQSASCDRSDGVAGTQVAPAEEGGSASATVGLEPEVWEELQRVMRGMDPSQLLDLVQPLGAGAEAGALHGGAGAGDGAPLEETHGQSSGGGRADADERAYDPQAGQLVLLLLARIDKQPAVGADMVQMELEPSGRVSLSSPHLDAFLAPA